MYYLIGITLVLTFLFVINLTSAFAVSLAWWFVSRIADTWPPRRTSAVLFTLRIFPIATALLYSFGLALPAYILFEPHVTEETIGFKQWILVAACGLGLAFAAFRIFGSWWQTRKLLNGWLEHAEEIEVDGLDLPAYKVQHPFPVFAIVGVRKPKLFIAEQVLDMLDAFEISAVIKHELGHLAAFDNLKRIMMHLCGDLLLVPVGRNLDTVWTEASEIAADEFAVNKGGRRSALNLASALIKIARNVPSPQRDRLPVGSYAVQHDGELLSNRIQRLLALAESRENGGPDRVTRPLRVFSVIAASLLILLPLALDTYLLSHIHEISEGLLKSLR